MLYQKQKTTPLGHWIDKYSKFTFVENTFSDFPKDPRTKCLGSDRFSCFGSICKLGSFKNLFTTITCLPELYFRLTKFILLVQMKEMISMSYDSSTSCWKLWRWVRLNMILTMRDIYLNSNLKPLTKFTSSRRSNMFKDILPWNISQMITKTIPIPNKIPKDEYLKKLILQSF